MLKTNKNTVCATTYLPYGAYKALTTLAKDHNGEIGKTPKGFFTAKFADPETAKAVKTRFEADYAKAHEAYVPKSKPTKETKSKPTSSKKKSISTKGNGFDFSKVKGETKKEKNKALHAMLVSMGVKDSRTDEYMSVWNARPWAK